MRKLKILSTLALSFILNNSIQAQTTITPLGKIARAETVNPIRPGIPGKSPFWNAHAERFIYAPAFEYKIIANAKQYRYKVIDAGNKLHTFEANVPYSALSKVWLSIPTGYFNLKVVALNSTGDSIGLAGSGKYYKAAFFNGPYHQPVMPYNESAKLALDKLLHKDYVEYWVKNKVPDPNYLNYCYPAKIYSALVIGAVTYARLKPNSTEAKEAVTLAKIVADYMLNIRYKAGSAWEYFVPTYYGKQYAPGSHVNPINNFTIMGVDAGTAFLDLYDITRDTKYLAAAKQIAKTYLKNQLDNGSWYQFANYENNKPLAPNIVIPTAVINYFNRLVKDYHMQGLNAASKKAFNYIMDNPVRTYNWQGQFEDVQAKLPYRNLSREQACDFAIYLFKNFKSDKDKLAIAEDLVRFSEDQFVIWEQPRNKKPQKDGPGWIAANWITPSVQEQYVFWNPVGRAAGIMIQTYYEGFNATGKQIYLAKAESIANALTLSQQAHEGDYPTFFTKYPMPLWLNSTVYPAKVMETLSEISKAANKN